MSHPFVEHIKKDYEKQREMGKRLREARNLKELFDTWNEYFMELYPHLNGEEASIFDFLESKGGLAQARADEAMEEHHVDKVLMKEINDLAHEGKPFHAKAYVLDKLNRVHIDEEEQVHLPLMEKLATEEEMDGLFKQKYEKREKEVKGEARTMLIRGK
jgi:hemerythrin-like domain-containing protein